LLEEINRPAPFPHFAVPLQQRWIGSEIRNGVAEGVKEINCFPLDIAHRQQIEGNFVTIQ